MTDSVGLPMVAGLLGRHKWGILLSALACGAGAGGVAMMQPPRFVAEGQLVAEPPSAPGEPLDRLTDVDVLQSRALLSRIATDLDLPDRPDFAPTPRVPAILRDAVTDLRHRLSIGSRPRAIEPAAATELAMDRLQANLRLDQRETSRVLTIRFEASTPDLAASVTNAIMRRYISDELAAKRDRAMQSRQWLDDRADLARRETEAADQRVKEFQDRHDVVTLQAGSISALQRSSEEARLAAANTELERAQAAYDTARRGDGASSREVITSPTVAALRQREADMLQRIAGNAAYLPGSSVREVLDNELRTIRAQIDAESAKVLAAMGRDVDLARQNKAAAQTQLENAQIDASTSKANLSDLAALTQDAESKRARYQALLARAQDASYEASQLSVARILSPAVPPARAEPSRLPIMLVLGMFGGALAAMASCLARQMFSNRISSTGDLLSASGAPGVGTLPKLRYRKRSGLTDLVLHPGGSALAETTRGIRLGAQDVSGAGRPVGLLITSADRGEGKSTVAAALACRAAGDGLRVLLIEADLHRPSLGGLLRVSVGAGIESVLDGSRDFADVVRVDPRSRLHCLLAQGSHANPLQLLGSARFADLLQLARAQYDLIVVDSPPMLRVADSALLARSFDVILFVARSHHTVGSHVAEAMRRFPAECRRRVVTILTHARPMRLGSQGFYGGYHDVPPATGGAAPLPGRQARQSPVKRIATVT